MLDITTSPPSPNQIIKSFNDDKTASLTPSPNPEEGTFENHQITAVPLSQTVQKKVTFSDQITSIDNKTNLNDSPFVEENISDSTNTIVATQPSNKIIFLSRSIEKWAADLADQKASELQDAEDALAYVKNNPTALPPQTQSQSKEWHALIRDQAARAKKYALWTTYRTELLKGNKSVQVALAQLGQSIDTQWTLEQLHEDWDLAKEEPWAKDNPQYDELKNTIATLVAQYRQTQREIQEAKTTSHQKKSDNIQTTHNTNKYEPDNINVPGFGDLDRNKYDIGSVEWHLDEEGNRTGGYTIFDMTGRRYDYP